MPALRISLSRPVGSKGLKALSVWLMAVPSGWGAGPRPRATSPLQDGTAVDVDLLPGDVIAVGGQEDHRPGDLLRLGETAQRDLGLDLGLDVAGHPGEHVGFGVTGRDAIDRDVGLRQLH